MNISLTLNIDVSSFFAVPVHPWLTILYCRWEESDDEGRENRSAPPEANEESKKSEPKPTKGRRIRIKRKSPPKSNEESVKKSQSVETPTEKSKSHVQSAVKKIDSPAPSKDVIPDARMVITFRRNSRHNEEQGRRVSLGNTDEARFEPVYAEATSSPESRSSGKVSSRSTLLRTASRESRAQDDPDALKLSEYSNFSNEGSEKLRKQSKKKKKKKKKRKLRSQISNNDEEDLRKKSSRSYDDSQSDDRASSDHERRSQRRNLADDRKRHRRESSIDEKSQKKETKKKRRDESREKLARNSYESKSRERRRERDRDYGERQDDRYDRSRDKRRKKDKRQKHRRRRDSSSEYSDADIDVR